MLFNYFRIAYRHLAKSKTYSLISVMGLSVGITAFFLILQYASFELSYDLFHKNEIYRVAHQKWENGEMKNSSAMNYGGVRSLLKTNIPEIEHVTGFSPMPNNLGFLFGYKGKLFLEPGKFLRVDSNFFKVFSSLLIKGDPNTALNDSKGLVISESVAKKVFKDEDPIGKRFDDQGEDDNECDDCLITGVIRDMPANSHLHADFVMRLGPDWDGSDGTDGFGKTPSFYTYVSVQNGIDRKQLETKTNGILKKLEKTHPDTKGASLLFQPISSIHLESQLGDELEANGSKTLVYIIVFIGLIILIIAWINYVNIETARFVSRTREVGVRRIVGSGKGDLILQFLVEYFCLNVLALGVAGLLLLWIIPHFSYFTGIPLETIQWSTPNIWIGALVIFVFGSILTGIYPVWFLLKINPVNSLKGAFGGINRGLGIRKSLVIVQFTVSLALIAFLLVVNGQLEFMQLTNKKIDLEKVIAIRNPTAYGGMHTFEIGQNEFNQFENKLQQHSSIKMMTASSAIPGTEIGFTFINLLKRSLSDPYSPVRYKTLFIDQNYIPVYGLKLKAGRNFSHELGEDVDYAKGWLRGDKPPKDYYQTLLLNESAIHALGFNTPEEAVNQIIYYHLWADDFEKYKIVGVVEDYHHEALKKEVFPTIFALNHGGFQQVYYSVKAEAGSNTRDVLSHVEKSWKELFPNKPFDYFFIDDYYDQQFKSELYFSRIFGLFAGVAVFIACLGILGMTLFEANARIKELSIRKVLGASVTSLMALLSKGYFKLIFLSALVSIPLIYWSASKWLEKYPVRAEVNAWYFIFPLVAVIIMVMFASGVQTFKAANSNPVDNLKHE
ncbi:MAG TPA: FtsX-like permease family protein [Cyclobacteriaceae bacterium]